MRPRPLHGQQLPKGNRTGKAGTLKATDEAAKGEPMTETKQTSTTKTDRRPDCVTEIRMGNSVLTVSGFFKQGATDTAADKMMAGTDEFWCELSKTRFSGERYEQENQSSKTLKRHEWQAHHKQACVWLPHGRG